MTANNKLLQLRPALRGKNDDARLKRFASGVRKLRKARGISRRAFADRIGLSYSNTANIESGHNWPSVPVYRKICEVLMGRRAPLL